MPEFYFPFYALFYFEPSNSVSQKILPFHRMLIVKKQLMKGEIL